MKANACAWRNDNLHGWSNRREAAAKQAVAKEAARTQAKRDEVALFPELAAQHKERFTTTEERKAQLDARELRMTREIRTRRATDWRKARAAYYALPATRREGIRRFWASGIYPADPSYLATALQEFAKAGCSPWTALRKKRLITLWREGRIARPAKPLEITRNFKSI